MRTSFLALRFALPFGVAVLVALGLSGCSGGDPSDPDASIAGTWDLQSGLTNVYATVSTNQNALNPFAPGTGGVVLTGDAAATLRYYLGQSPGGEGYVGNAPLLNGDDVTVLIRLGAGGPTEVEVVLGAPGAGPQRTLDLISYDGASPTTRAEGYIEFHNALFRDPDDATFEVTVNGRLTFILVPLTAGVSARVGVNTYVRADADILTRAFETGGVYSQINDDLTETTGTWSDLGAQVRVRIGAETTDYGYSISGSTLSLTEDDPNVCSGVCPDALALFFGIDGGTLTALRYEETETLTRVADSFGLESPAPPTARSFGLESPQP